MLLERCRKWGWDAWAQAFTAATPHGNIEFRNIICELDLKAVVREDEGVESGSGSDERRVRDEEGTEGGSTSGDGAARRMQPRTLVLAAHYDSKVMTGPRPFLAATDR
jgi:hypothetical protein